MNPFKIISRQEYESLLNFPVYISLLAANLYGNLDEVEKKSAIKFAHIKTFSCDPLLSEFYEEAEKVFEDKIEQLDNELPKEKESRDAAIKKELSILEEILMKLGNDYKTVMHNSMTSFKEHVSNAYNNVLSVCIWPFPIK